MAKREFEYQDESSHKFWSIELKGESHTVTYGRAGTDGQTKTKAFTDAEAARKSSEKLISQKTSKGYVEKSAPRRKKTVRKPATKKKPATKRKPAAKKKKGAKKKSPKQASSTVADLNFELPVSTLTDARTFVFDDGSSHKFWAIATKAATSTVNYGRVGTAGQTRKKTLTSPAAARTETTKLIQEKLRKGYVEIDAEGNTLASPPVPPVKRGKPLDSEEVMYRIEKGDAFGIVCTGNLSFLGEAYKRQSRRWNAPIKRKPSKAVELPAFLTAQSVLLSNCAWLKAIPPEWDVYRVAADGCKTLLR